MRFTPFHDSASISVYPIKLTVAIQAVEIPLECCTSLCKFVTASRGKFLIDVAVTTVTGIVILPSLKVRVHRLRTLRYGAAPCRPRAALRSNATHCTASDVKGPSVCNHCKHSLSEPGEIKKNLQFKILTVLNAVLFKLDYAYTSIYLELVGLSLQLHRVPDKKGPLLFFE